MTRQGYRRTLYAVDYVMIEKTAITILPLLTPAQYITLQRETSIYFYQDLCYEGCQNDVGGEGSGA